MNGAVGVVGIGSGPGAAILHSASLGIGSSPWGLVGRRAGALARAHPFVDFGDNLAINARDIVLEHGLELSILLVSVAEALQTFVR